MFLVCKDKYRHFTQPVYTLAHGVISSAILFAIYRDCHFACLSLVLECGKLNTSEDVILLFVKFHC